MLIGGLQKTSLIDFPKKIAAIVFTHGCNFRCPYCHNPELVTGGQGDITQEYVLNFLENRRGKLDGVVVTGGEPCLQKDLPDFLRILKEMDYAVKLDTNGSHYKMLKSIIDDELTDYIAMDIKAPVEKYETVANTNFNVQNIIKSIDLIMNSGVDYEFRTTVVKNLLSPQDFEKIGFLADGAEKYFIQNFLYTKTLDKTYSKAAPFAPSELKEAAELLKQHNINYVKIR